MNGSVSPRPVAELVEPVARAVARIVHPNVIRVIDLNTHKVDTFLGTPGKHDVGTDESIGFYEPGGLSLAGGTLYVADTNHHRVVAVDVATKKARVLKVEVGKTQ